MILVDTNVISEPLRPRPEPRVRDWLGPWEDQISISAISLGELIYGVEQMPLGRRRDTLQTAIEGLQRRLAGRILPVDDAVASGYGRLMAARRSLGRPLPILDALIAATALVHGLSLATRNTRDFEGLGLELINPWEA